VTTGLGGVTDGFSVVADGVLLGWLLGAGAVLEGVEPADPPPPLQPAAASATTVRGTANGRQSFMDTLLVAEVGCFRR
jgi:hypothetical protein